MKILNPLFHNKTAPQPLPPVDLNPALIRITWTCFAGTVLSALLAVIHANLHPLSQLWFIPAQLTCITLILALFFQAGNLILSHPRRLLLLPSLVLWLVLAVKMSSSSFSYHDEIYSWNLWAIEHWQRKPYDLYYTQASYPQLFSYWLASIYGAQAGFTSQAFTRFASSVPTLLLIGSALALCGARSKRNIQIISSALLAWTVLRTWSTLRLGYADPLMTAGLIVSVVCLIAYTSDQRMRWWVMSAAAAAAAAATKQPAVLWAAGGLPLIALLGWVRNHWTLRSLLIASASALVVAWMTFFVSADITNNPGVVTAAFRDRGVVGTLAHSVWRYLILKPDILALLVASWWYTRKHALLHAIWWIAIPVQIGLWFTLGSYEIRHGTHVIWLASILLLAALNMRHEAGETPQTAALGARRRSNAFALALMLGCAGIAVIYAGNLTGTDLKDGQKSAFAKQMRRERAADLYKRIVDSQARVLTTSNYSWGLFYGRTPLERAAPQAEQLSMQQLRDRLLEKRVDFAISSGAYAYGHFSAAVLELAATCPDAMAVELTSADGEFSVFEIRRTELEQCRVE